ncbi:histidine ammonia-lyase-like [Alosa sapidissima]|uniref:histidine ammonia-lyase-like n=1 Tax=Alosa sapidissima TaxID=34773 RepID=UPI001C096236|nr:histidine ammonia-lyase-like [Alosa sapidissima]
MLRVSVRVSGEWVVMMSGDPSLTLRHVGQNAIARCTHPHPPIGGAVQPRFQVRRCTDGAPLNQDEPIANVIHHGDFVDLVMDGDCWPQPTGPVFTSAQTEWKEPTEYIALDGESLTTDDLVRLGKGLLKIKVILTFLIHSFCGCYSLH